nr:hypothetical protein GCM10020092_042100 [Actinoplanes digitatis]
MRRRNEARPSRYKRVAISVLVVRGDQGTLGHGDQRLAQVLPGLVDDDAGDAAEQHLRGEAVRRVR